MKFAALCFAFSSLCLLGSGFFKSIKIDNLECETTKLRRERDMYDSLWRSANTRIMRFQDSVNLHCICK